MRSKLVLKLNGIARLVSSVRAESLRSDDDLECMLNLMDCLAVCILDGEENLTVFKDSKGYDKLVREWLPCRYLRHDALKLLSCAMTICPPEHV